MLVRVRVPPGALKNLDFTVEVFFILAPLIIALSQFIANEVSLRSLGNGDTFVLCRF